MERPKQSEAQLSDHTSARWVLLYRTAAVAAFTSAALIPIQVAVFLIWRPPIDGTAVDWFTLFHEHRLAGLIDLDLLLTCVNVLMIPILLSVYVALRSGHESMMTIATALGLGSAIMYIGSNPAVQMASLSDQYAAATTDAQRLSATAAAQALLAIWQGTAFHAAYVLGSVGGILIGIAMVRSGVFSKVTGWLAVVANTVAFGLYVPNVGVFISVFSVLFLEIWYLLIARRLGRLGRDKTTG